MPTEKNKNNIELRNDEVRDILQKMPHWTIRWGITIIFVSIVLLLVFSYFYRYPDLIRADIVISSTNPPAQLKARATGKIIELKIADGDVVLPNQLLASIESSANINDVLLLDSLLNGNSELIKSFQPYDDILFNSSLKLGDIQVYYSDFIQSRNDLNNFNQQKLYNENIQSAEQRLEMQKLYYDRLWSQRSLMEDELKLAKQSFDRDSQLYVNGVIPLSEYEQLKKTLIGQQLNFEKIRTQLATTQSGIYELEQQLATLKIQLEEKGKNYKLALIKAFDILKSSISNWKIKYQLYSPIEGKVSLNKIWASNQNVKEGETVLSIVPDLPEGIVGKAYLPVEGAGKVKVGQRVNIKLSNYPYMQYGMLLGVLKRIAPVPVNNFYTIEIELPNQMTTNYGKTLEVQQELSGKCEIITEDLRLIQRVIYPIKALVERNKR